VCGQGLPSQLRVVGDLSRVMNVNVFCVCVYWEGRVGLPSRMRVVGDLARVMDVNVLCVCVCIGG